jgi:hypothetical protein
MIAIPPAPNAEGYRKTLMSKYLVGATVNPLRQYMLLPKNVSEAKVILMSQIELNPYMKDSDPKIVIDNLRKMATQYFHNTGRHLDLRIDVPKEMLLLSSEPDAESVSSRHSRMKEEFESADDEELSEAELTRQEKALEEEAKRKQKQKELRARKAELDEKRRRLREDTD